MEGGPRPAPALPAAPDLTLCVLSIASLGAVAMGAMTGARPDGPTLCLFRLVTGLPCPFCGTTRSLFELGQGHIAASVELSPLGLVVPVVAVVVLVHLTRARLGAAPGRWPPGLLFLGLAFVAASWLLQMTKGVL